MTKQTILIVFGGESSEHEVSIMSARNVYGAIDKEKYDTKLCFITRDGNDWLLVQSFDDLSGATFTPNLGKKSFTSTEGEIKIDVLLPILHGENGHEDGAIQGLARLMHLPVIGCRLGASAVCWDKLYTKQLLHENGISVTPYEIYRKNDPMLEYGTVAPKLGNVLFIKPTVAGSSIGVSKVHNEGEFEPAITEALKHSDSVLIEQSIEGRELEVAVLGNPPHHKISGVGEIIPGEEFYSYDDKYSPDSKAQVLSHADLSDEVANEICDTAHKAYAVLGCSGLARVDFLMSDDNTIYLNELNTLPGFTNISQYPKLWEEAGVTQTELISRLIDSAQA